MGSKSEGVIVHYPTAKFSFQPQVTRRQEQTSESARITTGANAAHRQPGVDATVCPLFCWRAMTPAN
jgi:hypothetical protein